jgi:hypothetical protein
MTRNSPLKLARPRTISGGGPPPRQFTHIMTLMWRCSGSSCRNTPADALCLPLPSNRCSLRQLQPHSASTLVHHPPPNVPHAQTSGPGGSRAEFEPTGFHGHETNQFHGTSPRIDSPLNSTHPPRSCPSPPSPPSPPSAPPLCRLPLPSRSLPPLEQSPRETSPAHTRPSHRESAYTASPLSLQHLRSDSSEAHVPSHIFPKMQRGPKHSPFRPCPHPTLPCTRDL